MDYMEILIYKVIFRIKEIKMIKTMKKKRMKIKEILIKFKF
jgi:hypothetical protein